MFKKSMVGRPPIIDKEIIDKLERCFSLGCSDAEACCFANISTTTLYNYQKTNPEFIERKEMLKNKPILEARNTVVQNLRKDPKLALEYLKAKKKDEFGQRMEVTGANGEALAMPSIINVVPVRAKEEDGK